MTSVPRLHLISNSKICPVERFPDVARAAAQGGTDAIHIREPNLSDEELRDLIRSTQEALRGLSCRLLVNTRTDIAAESGADGVHLPEHGADPAAARDLLAPGCLVGVSVHSVDAATRAEKSGADYLIAGHIYETGSKPGQPGRGLEFIRNLAASVQIPVIGIGGVVPENAFEVIQSGAHGVAVISAILAADDPKMISTRFVRAMNEAEVNR